MQAHKFCCDNLTDIWSCVPEAGYCVKLIHFLVNHNMPWIKYSEPWYKWPISEKNERGIIITNRKAIAYSGTPPSRNVN
jgi:hypothetical protein